MNSEVVLREKLAHLLRGEPVIVSESDLDWLEADTNLDEHPALNRLISDWNPKQCGTLDPYVVRIKTVEEITAEVRRIRGE